MRLHRHVLTSFLGPFLFALATLSFILVSQFMVMYLHKITGTGISPGDFLLLWIFTLGRILITAVPIAVLAAGVMSFGNLAEYHELTAAKSSGIGLWAIMRPLVILSLALMALMYYASCILIPDANLRFQQIVYDLSQKRPEMVFQPGYFHNEIENYVIWISEKNPQSGTLYNILVYDHSQNDLNTQVMMADSAQAELTTDHSSLKMVLYHGSRHEAYENADSTQRILPYGRTYFDSLYFHLDLKGISQEKDERMQHRNTLRIQQLANTIDTLAAQQAQRPHTYTKLLCQQNGVDSSLLLLPDSFSYPHIQARFRRLRTEVMAKSQTLEKETLFTQHFQRSITSNWEYIRAVKLEYEYWKKQIRKYEYEYYSRLAFPINVVFFMLIGVSLGSLVNKGGIGIPALICTIAFILYFLAVSQGEKLTKTGIIKPWAGALIPVLIFSLIAVVLTYSAVQESSWLKRDWKGVWSFSFRKR
ncbi:MAG: LptF/LptG family permease [Bacteroidota bacterium]